MKLPLIKYKLLTVVTFLLVPFILVSFIGSIELLSGILKITPILSTWNQTSVHYVLITPGGAERVIIMGSGMALVFGLLMYFVKRIFACDFVLSRSSY